MNKDDWNARYAASERVWSEEPNRFLVEEIASLTPGRALDDWIEGDVERLLSVGPDYDLVLLFYLQLPWESMWRSIAQAAASVAPGGTFLLVGHDRRNLEHGHGGPKSADVLYTPADVTRILTGLAIVEAGRRERPVETDDGEVWAIDCLVRAVVPT